MKSKQAVAKTNTLCKNGGKFFQDVYAFPIRNLWAKAKIRLDIYANLLGSPA